MDGYRSAIDGTELPQECSLDEQLVECETTSRSCEGIDPVDPPYLPKIEELGLSFDIVTGEAQQQVVMTTQNFLHILSWEASIFQEILNVILSMSGIK
jgi:hypothetical protein